MRRLRYISGALLAVLWIAPLRAQEPAGTVRGRVVEDATQQPLARVTVAVGSRGALTQADGSYIITSVPAGPATLRVRMLGYEPVTRSITVVSSQATVVDVAMTARAISLAEIVVTGYGEQTAGDITGAVATVTPDEFNPGRTFNAQNLIQGKVAGVQVEDNNEPGGGMSIRIRGVTSVNAGSDPLYVIDGMPVGSGGLSAGRNPLNFLNPNDIESITVLKDASAASIYGANSANGVVIITTKSATGRQGQQLEYGASFSTSSVTKLPSMLNATQYRAAVTQYAPTNVSQLASSTTDWFGLVSRSAVGQDHNLSLTSATGNVYYRLALGYLNQEGIIRGTTTERLALGLNYEQHLFSQRLGLKVNLKGSRAIDRFTPDGVISNAAQFGPTQPVYDTASTTGYYEWPGNRLQSADNPVAILGLATDRGTTWRSVGNVQTSYRMPFLDALKLNFNFGYDVTQTERLSFTPNTLHSQTKNGNFGNFSRSTPNNLSSLVDAYLNYNAPLGILPGNVDVTAGYSYGQSHRSSPWFYENGLSTNLLGESGIPTASTVANGLYITDSKLISYFGRLNYNLNDRYIAGFSLRRDGSSRFGPGNQWGVFPSASFAWRLSQMPFMRGIAALSDLKFRASWAKTGNQNIGDYLQYPTYTYGNSQAQYWMGNRWVTTIRPSAVDQNIKWEATASTNLGLDFGFLNQRFAGSIDWYTKKTTDMIFYVPVAGGTTLSNYVTTNIGSMKNTGLEFSLSAKLIDGRGGDLAWTADFTASTNTNELLNINPNAIGSQQILTGGVSGGVGTYIQVLQPGVAVNSFFVCRQAYGTDGKPLENKFLSLVGDTVLTGCANNERRPYHNPLPKWQLGHTSRFTYHSFDMSFTLRAYLGAYTYNNIASNLGTYAEVTRGSPYNLHTSVLTTGFTTPQYLSDYYVESASFLRMDNITLGYSFNFRSAPWRAYVTVQNAFTITGYSGVDPTAGLGGIDNNLYPRSRIVTGGMSVRF
jgi:iron complex outermembrane receptor protein